MANKKKQTQTGGGKETKGYISGLHSLAVGMPPNAGPAGWTWVKLSDVARLETGHTPSRKHPEYWGGDIPWIGIRDATANHGQTLQDTNQHTNDLGISNSSARILPKNTVCLSRTASVGYVVVMGRPMATSQDFVNWVCSEGINHQFLKYILLSENGSFASFASGTTHQTIYFPEVKGFHVCLPSITTQRKIAAVLTAYDDLIENNTRRIAILEEMAQTLYREWFVNFRYPGHENVKLVDSELGKIPEGWEARTLGDEIELPYGKALKAANRKGGDVAVYGSSGVVGYHDESLSDGPGIIVGRKGNVGSVFWSDVPFYPIDTAFFVKTTLPLHFVYFNLLLSQQFLNSDAAVPGLNRNQAYSNPLIVPASDVLESFTKQITSIFSLTRSLRSRIENLRNTRDLLLPKLISGKLNVEDLDIRLDESIQELKVAKQETPKPTSKKTKKRAKGTPYKDDAAVVCVLLDELMLAKRSTSEFSIQKHLFALKHRQDLPIHAEFAARAAGPWSHALKRKTFFTATKTGWLQFSDQSKKLSKGHNFDKGLAHAKQHLGDRYPEVRSMVADLVKFGDKGLERWMTVFKVVLDLTETGVSISRKTIQKGIFA